MNREFQIRIENVNDDYDVIDVFNYTNLAEANAAYNALLEEDTEGHSYSIELVEVMRQDTICRLSEYHDTASPFAMKGGAS